MEGPQKKRKKCLLFDRRYGWVYDEWREPSEEALAGGRGMFCVVPLAKSFMKTASQSINAASSSVIKIIESPELLSPQKLQASLGDELSRLMIHLRQPKMNLQLPTIGSLGLGSKSHSEGSSSKSQSSLQKKKMKFIVGVCVVLSMAMLCAGRRLSNPYSVIGRVYCDTCRSGFETPITSYIAGAKVSVQCRHRNSQELLYSAEGTTDSSGSYKIMVHEDQGDRVCDAVLISSPLSACRKPDPGRDRSRVVLTSYNGMTSSQRYANALGFVQEYSLAACTQVLQQYKLDEDDF